MFIGLILAHDIKNLLDNVVPVEVVTTFLDPVLGGELLHKGLLLRVVQYLEACLDDAAALLVHRILYHMALDFLEYNAVVWLILSCFL